MIQDLCQSQDPITNTTHDHFNDLLHVLNFYEMNVMQSGDQTSLITGKIIEILKEMALEKLRADHDLTLMVANIHQAKELNVILPYLFKTSKSGSHDSFYNDVITILLEHLQKRNELSLDTRGAMKLLKDVLEVEPNVDKQKVAQVFDLIRHQVEKQFEPLMVELSAKENAVQAFQEVDQVHNGFDETVPLSLRLAKYQKLLSTVIDFANEHHDKFLSVNGSGVNDDLLKKQAKMLFEYVLKCKYFKDQMKRLGNVDFSFVEDPQDKRNRASYSNYVRNYQETNHQISCFHLFAGDNYLNNSKHRGSPMRHLTKAVSKLGDGAFSTEEYLQSLSENVLKFLHLSLDNKSSIECHEEKLKNTNIYEGEVPGSLADHNSKKTNQILKDLLDHKSDRARKSDNKNKSFDLNLVDEKKAMKIQ